MQEIQVQSLAQEDSLEKEMATLQCSCLENSTDEGVWQVTVHGFAESDRTEHGCTHSPCFKCSSAPWDKVKIKFLTSRRS